ncbi:MAG TPA: hypothetical protein VNZ53_48365, partial [Steroidobacteraceae bacterium]|nr:hypothetical protein [Steroidobacteraceae bacterium]
DTPAATMAAPAANMTAAATAMAAAATTAVAATATTASAARHLREDAGAVFPIEEMERGETDVLHFLFAKEEALIRRGVVRLRDISGGHRGSRCNTEQ